MTNYQRGLSLIIDSDNESSLSDEPVTPMTSDDEMPAERPRLLRWTRVLCHIHGGFHHVNDQIIFRLRICNHCKGKLISLVEAREERVRQQNIRDARAILPSFCDVTSVGNIVVDFL